MVTIVVIFNSIKVHNESIVPKNLTLIKISKASHGKSCEQLGRTDIVLVHLFILL